MKKYKGKTFEFTITRADYMNSSKNFQDIDNCAMAKAFNRQFPGVQKVYVDPYAVHAAGDRIAEIQDQFNFNNYEVLKNYGKKFTTKITFS